MTLPNQEAGLASQGLEFAFTNDGSIPGAPARTQTNIENTLKGEMQGSPGWNFAHGSLFTGLPEGVPFVFGFLAKLAERITGLPVVDWVEGIAEGIDWIFTGIGTFFARLTSMFGDAIDWMVEGTWNAVDNIFDWVNNVLMETGLITAWNDFQDLINRIWMGFTQQGLPGGLNIIVEEIQEFFHNIPWLNIQGWTEFFQNIWDTLFGGFARLFGISGKSVTDVANEAAALAEKAEQSRDLSEWNNAILGIRNNKPLMMGMDETSESNFLMDTMFDGNTLPPYVTASLGASPVAFWMAEEDAKKGFISWFGEGYLNITNFEVAVYKLNKQTQTLDVIHVSPDLSFMLTGEWLTHVYYLDEADRFDVAHGDIFAIAFRVTGDGSHKIAGKIAGDWFPEHPTVHPKKPAAMMATLTSTIDFADITYANAVPWVGIGIVDGDTPPPFFAPRTTIFTEVGPSTYNIPAWANAVDVVCLGGGGGGHGGDGGLSRNGQGGRAGTWATETLIRGVDFPVDATSFGVLVGAGGTAGPREADGGAGGLSRRTNIPSGKAALIAAGGAGGDVYNSADCVGLSPGSITYNGQLYVGGGTASSPQASNGSPGSPPGGGGGGGAGGTFTIAWAGAVGGRGCVWCVAKMA